MKVFNIILTMLVGCKTCFTQDIILIYDQNGNRLTKQIISNIPVAGISGDSVVCEYDIAQLDASGGSTYSWSTGASQANISIIADTTREYSVTVSSGSGCKDTATFHLEVTDVPALDSISGVTGANYNDVVTYEVGNYPNITYNWSVTNGTIVNGYGTHQIQVQWDGSGTGTVNLSSFVTGTGCEIPELNKSVQIATGIGEVGGLRCSLYPNPSGNIVYLSIVPHYASDITINIHDHLGSKTYTTASQIMGALVIPLQKELFGAAGVYTIAIKTKKETIIKKAIITN